MTIPAELKRGTPRAVSLTRAGWVAILWPSAIALFIVIGLIPGQTTHSKGLLHSAEQAASYWNHPLVDLGLILPGAGIGWMRYRTQLRLLRYGRAAVATVNGYERPWWRILYKGPYRVLCRFRMLNGSFFTAAVEAPQREVPETDTDVIIIYDPDDPKKSTIYPTRMLRVAGYQRSPI